MTTLYKPVLIESAEQAEALPEGTLFRAPSEPFAPHFYVKESSALYEHDGGYMSVGPAIIGWTALVPIEAEVETEEVARHPLAVELGWPDKPARIYTARWVERD